MKNRLSIDSLVVIFSLVITSSAFAAPPSPAELLQAPEGVACKVVDDSGQIFNISWSEIEGAKKYAVELSCDSSVGDLNIEAEVSKKSILCADGTCAGSISEAEVAETIQQAIDSGKIELPELADGETLGWLCRAEVKGLNPPGKSQNHPKGKAACIEESATVCPVWSAGELAEVGHHTMANPVLFQRIGDLEDRTYDVKANAYIDHELVVDSTSNLMNAASVYLSGENFVGNFVLTSTADSSENVDRSLFITEAEYEVCKEDLINHQSSFCPANLFSDQDGNCVAY